MRKISGELPCSNLNPAQFSTLPPLAHQETQILQKLFSAGKAITFDAFSDVWFKSTPRTDLICNLWNPAGIEQLQSSFEARLVPLNKAWPNIPREDEFHPIVILSPAYKWLELRFIPKLRSYL
jgi:hypothetical protein